MSSKFDYCRLLPPMSVAKLLLEYLKLEKVQDLFGVPGGALMHILNELKNQKTQFKYYICRHETGAAYMADGYSRVTGKLGVVLVTSGPGATNALTGTMNAQNGNTAVLTISGEVPEILFGKGYLQEGVDVKLDINAIYRNASQFSAIVTSPDNFQTLFTQAIREAMNRSPQATHISIPDDIAGQCPTQPILFPAYTDNYRTVPHCTDRKSLKQALRHLLQAERPVILLGNGCRRALTDPEHPRRLDKFITLVTRFAIPVMTTPEAKGLFPESHPLSLRCYGFAACEWPKHYLLRDAINRKNSVPYDALLVIGSSLQGLATDRWDPMLVPDGPFMQIDLDHRVMGRAFPVSLGIVAEVEAALDDLIRFGRRVEPDKDCIRKRRALLRKLKDEFPPYAEPKKRNYQGKPIMPQALMRCLSELLPEQSHLFIDSGNCVGWGLHYLDIDPPRQVHSALDMGPMGFSVGAVIGAKIGDPSKTCVSLTGDGTFLMHGAEVSTAAENSIGAIWIVLEDYDLAMVSQGMNQFFPDPDGWKRYYKIGDDKTKKPDLQKYAESLGADAYTVERPAEMMAAFPKAVRGGSGRKPRPQVIVARIERSEIPPYYHGPAAQPGKPKGPAIVGSKGDDT
jgi:acetolactate synthase-1/2/3 large subunit